MLVTKVVAELGKMENPGVNLKSAPDEVACAECVRAKLPESPMNHSLVPEGTKLRTCLLRHLWGNAGAWIHPRKVPYHYYRRSHHDPICGRSQE
jgi:hypothetical protein